MQRYSKLWWASILLSSAVTGGSSFALLTLFTGLSLGAVVVVSVFIILAADVLLALLMQTASPTRVTVGLGERWHAQEAPADRAAVISDFEDGQGKVSVRGEEWQARQAESCGEQLAAGRVVRVVGRDRLTLLVAADGSSG